MGAGPGYKITRSLGIVPAPVYKLPSFDAEALECASFR